MRSRYSAFVLDLREYLLATWHPSSRPAEIEPPEAGLRWLGLRVKSAALGSPDQPMDTDAGQVAFVARYKIGGRAHRLEERSLFQREGGCWWYVGALNP